MRFLWRLFWAVRDQRSLFAAIIRCKKRVSDVSLLGCFPLNNLTYWLIQLANKDILMMLLNTQLTSTFHSIPFDSIPFIYILILMLPHTQSVQMQYTEYHLAKFYFSILFIECTISKSWSFQQKLNVPSYLASARTECTRRRPNVHFE